MDNEDVELENCEESEGSNDQKKFKISDSSKFEETRENNRKQVIRSFSWSRDENRSNLEKWSEPISPSEEEKMFQNKTQNKEDDSYRDSTEVVPNSLNIKIAAALVDSSNTGRSCSVSLHNADKRMVIWYKLSHNFVYLRNFLILVLMILSFFERPIWCFQSICNMVVDPENIVPGTNPQIYFSGIPKLSIYISMGIELFCLISLSLIIVLCSIMISGFKKTLFRPV